MPKRISTISTVVVREGKRIAVGPGSKHGMKPFDFTADEIKQISGMHPTALRKAVNETVEAEPTDDTAPEGDAGATATDTPKKSARKAAAEKDSTSKKATGGSKKPKAKAEAEAEDEDEDDADAEDGEGEDEDI